MDEREVEKQEHGFGCDDVVVVVNGKSRHSTGILHNVQGFFKKAKPLGLTFTKTQAFVKMLERMVYPAPTTTSPPSTNEKLKATNFPITSIRIGNWQRKSENEGELIAKLYFAKRKIVWEVLDEEVLPGNELKMKSKIEILWSNITAIQAILGDDDQPGILRIELDRPPHLFRETKPEPKKHTNWEINEDFTFTNGQAQTLRIHCVSFPPKVLDKHYENLLQSDQQLFKLSREPFPSQHSRFRQYPTNHHTVSRGLPIVRLPPNTVMTVPRNSPFVLQRQLQTNWELVNSQISGPNNVYSNGQPNGHLTFDEGNLHVQMQQPMDLVLDPSYVYPNGHNNRAPLPDQMQQPVDLACDPNDIKPNGHNNQAPMQNSTDNYHTGHCDARVQLSNIPEGSSNWTTMEEDVDYSVLPFVSPDDDDGGGDDIAG